MLSVNATHYGHLAPGVGVHVGIANGPSGHPPAHDKAVVQRRPGMCGGIGHNTVDSHGVHGNHLARHEADLLPLGRGITVDACSDRRRPFIPCLHLPWAIDARRAFQGCSASG